jgi:hypothetical protein
MNAAGRVIALDAPSLEGNPTLARGRRRLELLRLEHGDTSMLHEALERRDAVTVREIVGRS